MKTDLLFVSRFCFSLLLICVLIPACQKDHQVQQYTIDQDASNMEWKGYLKDGNGNNGTISLTGELFTNNRGEITGGEIKMPLSSLVNINLPSDELKSQLVHHLQSADFFNMAIYPQIEFKITSLAPDVSLPGVSHATGELTMLGKTNPVNFPVKVNVVADKLEVTGQTSIDRTLWGMLYASDENAADGMYIKPGIDVQFKLVAVQR